MAKKDQVFITSSEEGKGAYGILASTDENIYFPMSITEALCLEEFDEVEAIMVRNDRAEPAWRAIRARRLNDDDG
ncbi:hypothetical protein [Sphingomonas baiyangensis]|uniref:Uncharacterized protein n=1 Tax=Sphingomonas baiyangensis TaxID=2572576 RepID=A0A4U1L3T4_9SPHN|nr:hypothetical protein [Sphingomonas baiyangensis]TKD51392.1 hypothetical protein FBR43_11980 [Sphingomonas baiyangensis]